MISHDDILYEQNFKEMSNAMRHYSNLRFLIIPIHLAANGAILYGLASTVKELEVSQQLANVCALFLVSVIFLVFAYLECALNWYIDAFKRELDTSYPNSFWHHRPETHGWVHGAIILLYVSIAVLWWVLIVVRIIS